MRELLEVVISLGLAGLKGIANKNTESIKRTDDDV